MDVAIFGSVARGGGDDFSDYDVIAVLDRVEDVVKERLNAALAADLGVNIGLSIYSKKRLRVMWDSGSPFAWHLFLEAKPVDKYGAKFLSEWGAPAPYTTACADSEMMGEIINSACGRLAGDLSGGECYEAGLLYVGARNMAMFASRSIVGRFDFSRWAPYSLEPKIGFPLSREEYELLVAARHATTRGRALPSLEFCWLRSAASVMSFWGLNVREAIRREKDGI